MAFFQLVLKANKLKRARRIYHDEKLSSIAISRGEKPNYTLRQKIRHKKVLLKRKIRKVFKKLICCPESSWIYKKAVLLKTDGTVENYVLKSIFGFLGGVVLTYLFFIFFVFQLHFSLIASTFICSVLGVVLTIGLAFFPYVRCVVLLFLPIFFSKRGRQALMAYAFILTLAGPARNTLYNLGVLSESLACIQEQLKDAVKSVIDLIKHPFYALRRTITQIVKSIKAIVKKLKQMLIAMKRLIISLLKVIESALDWLANIVNICNKEFGTPYDRCQKMFEDAVEDCKKRLGDSIGKVCVVTNVARTVCLPLKPLDAICGLVSYVSNTVLEEVRAKMRSFSREMRAMFFVKIKFSHYYHMKTNKSRSLGEISKEISKEIKTRTQRFLGIFSWVGFLTSLFFIFLFLRVVYYRYKWLTSDRFDNHYLTSYMRDIDLKRARQDKETVFPLNWRERSKYISPTSILLAKSEKVRLAKSVVFLTMTCVKLGIYMGIDYCLFWTLDTIRFHGKNQPREQQRQAYAASVQVKGHGFLADLYRSIAKAFSPFSRNQAADLDAISCLPEPKPPNYDGYVQIATLALFCWIMALFEPYGLRLRHVVLSQYYPDRAKQRSVWLYNNIIRSRGSFLKYARRQLRRKFGTAHNSGIERVTLRERLWAMFPFLNRLAPMKLQNPCVLCGQPERDKSTPHVNCPTPNCVGVYCAQCFQDLNKLCTICLSPMDYGDLTDISEERDSSEEEVDQTLLKEKIEALRAKSKEDMVGKESEVIKEEVKREVEVVTDVSDDDSSKYSYSYQDESAGEPILPPQRPRFKDIEAQPIRDDVTMQIFSDTLCEEMSSSSGARVFCFGLGRRRKQAKRLVNDEENEKSDSTSIADTESWTTEEIDEQEAEEALDVEIEDFDEQKHSDDELLPDYCQRRRKKSGGIEQFFAVIGKMLSLKKKKQRTAYTLKNDKDSVNAGDDVENSSSSISSGCDENRELIALREVESKSSSTLRKRNNRISRISEDEQETCFIDEPLPKAAKPNRLEECRYSYQMKFETQELPKHLQYIYKNTKYYEIDESSPFTSPREKIRYKADFSTPSDTRSSVDSDPSRERLSSISDPDNDSCIYTSENNEKRYETRSSSSDSFLPNDLDFSEMSSDFFDDQRTLCPDNDEASNYQAKSANNYKEDKINEDSDEKGSKYLKKIVYRRKKFHESSSDTRDTDDLFEKMNKQKTTDQTSKDSEESSLDTKTSMIEKIDDILRKDKVDKETANARKRSSLILEKSSDYDNDSVVRKIDKSIGVREMDIELSMKQCEGRCFKKNSSSYVAKKTDFSENTKCKSIGKEDEKKEKLTITDESWVQPATRDQGTYVRLKSKRFKFTDQGL